MSYIGKTPTAVPLTSSDITNGIITTAKIADDAISAAKLASGVGGKVLQVVSAHKTDTSETTSTSFTDISSLSLNITPVSESSKIYLSGEVSMSNETGTATCLVGIFFNVASGSYTQINMGDSSLNRSQVTAHVAAVDTRDTEVGSFTFLHTPTYTLGNTLNYKLQFKSQSGGYIACIGRQGTDGNAAYTGRMPGNLTLMEIVA